MMKDAKKDGKKGEGRRCGAVWYWSICAHACLLYIIRIIGRHAGGDHRSGGWGFCFVGCLLDLRYAVILHA